MLKKYLLILLFLFSTIAKGQTIDYSNYNQGITFKNLGDYPNAILSFKKFIQQYPSEYPVAYFHRGKSFFQMNQFEAAITDLKKVLQLDEVNKEAPYALGKIFFQQKKYEEALKYFTQSIQLNPNDALSYNDRGLVKCHLRKYEQALGDFSQATQLDPTFAMAFNNAGTARYFKQDIAKPTSKDLREATDFFSKAIQIDPTLALAYRNRAAMYLLTKDNKNALIDLIKSKALDASDAMTFFYLGAVYANQSQNQFAFAAFRKALEVNPKLAIAHEEMGNLYKSEMNYDLAIREYQLAQTVRTEVGKLYKGLLDYRIAVVYAEQKNGRMMYDFLEKAKSKGAFKDAQVYRAFQKEKAFNPYRLKKTFRRFQKSLFKIQKDNKFLNPDLGWFRMN